MGSQHSSALTFCQRKKDDNPEDLLAERDQEEAIAQFPYVEFTGRNSITCHTCQGAGYIPEVLVDDNGIRVSNVTFNKQDSLVVLDVTATLKIRNSNFYPVAVTNLFSQVQYMKAVVGSYTAANVSLIPPRSEHLVNFTVKAEVGGPSSYVYFYCTLPAILVHNIVIFMRTSMQISYIGHTSQSTLETQHNVDCGENSTAIQSLLLVPWGPHL